MIGYFTLLMYKTYVVSLSKQKGRHMIKYKGNTEFIYFKVPFRVIMS